MSVQTLFGETSSERPGNKFLGLIGRQVVLAVALVVAPQVVQAQLAGPSAAAPAYPQAGAEFYAANVATQQSFGTKVGNVAYSNRANVGKSELGMAADNLEAAAKYLEAGWAGATTAQRAFSVGMTHAAVAQIMNNVGRLPGAQGVEKPEILHVITEVPGPWIKELNDTAAMLRQINGETAGDPVAEAAKKRTVGDKIADSGFSQPKYSPTYFLHAGKAAKEANANARASANSMSTASDNAAAGYIFKLTEAAVGPQGLNLTVDHGNKIDSASKTFVQQNARSGSQVAEVAIVSH